MAQLRLDYQKFVERNTEIVVIGPEDEKTFGSWWHNNRMPFTGIADADHTIADLYGQQVKLLKLGRTPATVLIDRKGQIRYSHYGESMSDIPPVSAMLSLIDELNREN